MKIEKNLSGKIKFTIIRILNERTNIKKTGMFIFFISCIYFTKETNFLFYNSTDSPDFFQYIIPYFDYLFKNTPITGREQGLFYYYIHSWYFYLNYSNLNDISLFTTLHKSIQEVNFIFFLIGLGGIYKLLRLFKFDYYVSLLSLIFINFLPLSIAQRIVFKPEILTFALFPWIIFCLEKFKKSREIKYLFLGIPLLVLCISSKGTIFIMIGLFLLVYYLKDLINLELKSIFYLIIFFLVISSLLISENNTSNGQSLLEVASGATNDSNYDYKAPISIIYKVNVYNLISSPINNYHPDSFIAITLLDTFGDYYNIYWDNDSSLFYENRREILEFRESKEIKGPVYNSSRKSFTIYLQVFTETYYKEIISFILSGFFYFMLIKEIKFNKKLRKFLIAPLFGMSIILFHIISGFPVNNFNPNLGDTLKPIYYGHFVLLAASFLTSKLFEKNIINKLLIIPYIFLVLLLIGFPKNIDTKFQKDVSQINSYSNTCSVNNIFLYQLDYIENKECIKGYIDRQIESDVIVYDDFNKTPRFKTINSIIGIGSLFSLFFLIFESTKLRRFRFGKVK
tara:strand:- start:2974 stop:4677 length:1704 start_codon:yes stop_codon:yes gene_type:complete